MANWLKISFLVSMYFAGFTVLISTETTNAFSPEEIHDTDIRSFLKQKQPVKLDNEAFLSSEGKEAELANKLRHVLLTNSYENGNVIDRQIQEIYDKSTSPTPAQIRQIFILNKALYKEKIEFMRERNAFKKDRRQALKPNMFKKPTASLKKEKSLGIRETQGTIHKTKQASRVMRNFFYHKEHWKTQREKGLKLGRWASTAYGK